MTERNRFLLKQFSGDANNNGVFGSYESDNATVSNDPDTIQSLPAYDTGWEDATTSGAKLPRLEEMQGLQYLFCKAIKELYSEGIPFWMAGETYYLGSVCMYFDENNDFALYRNISGNNGSNIPPVDTVNWVKLVVDGADKDLSNLSSAGKNIANWSSNVTNCITEIPQDIKLELNNGVLTLKAGSKVYVPNGTDTFDEVVINSDKTTSVSSSSGFVFYRSDNNSIHLEALQPTSGTTPPSGDGTWYDTNANKIKRYENSSFAYDGISFPLCKCSSGSIDQIFNGFGYIGSTVFALPGVKGLIPDGRKADGSLKNIELTYNHVITKTFTGTADTVLIFRENSIGEGNKVTYHESINYNEYGYTETDIRFCIMGSMTITAGVISNWNPKTQFGHQAMPSNRYVDLTLLASGSGYTSPADGYVVFSKLSGSSVTEQFVEIGFSNGNRNRCPTTLTETTCCATISVKKGQGFYTTYSANGNTLMFRFIYTEGSK